MWQACAVEGACGHLSTRQSADPLLWASSRAGCGMDSREQVLTHEAGVKVPIDLQNISVTVKGWVRVVHSETVESVNQPKAVIRAVKFELMLPPMMRLGPAGWSLDASNCGIGRHHSDRFQDPTLVRPQMSGKLYRTTLIRDKGEWYVLELCELLETLVGLNAEIYGYDGPQNLLTAITDAEKDPALMGFSLLGDEPALFPDIERQQPEDIQIAPEDVVIGRETEDGVEMQEGVQVPLEGKLVFSPSPTDMVLVNGVELTHDSSLQGL